MDGLDLFVMVTNNPRKLLTEGKNLFWLTEKAV
jgi:hypothetical protein